MPTPMPPPATLTSPRKRRILAEVLTPGRLSNGTSTVSIEASSKALLGTYQSRGLVVSINGSGTLQPGHPVIEEARRLATFVAAHDGILLHGGRDSGIMQAVAETAGTQSLGIIFPELEHQQAQGEATVVVNSPTPRIELLATCAPVIVIFRGGLGTLMVLMRAIVHLRNREFHPAQPPQLVYVSNYWVALLTTMMNMGALPREFLTGITIFERADQIVRALPTP